MENKNTSSILSFNAWSDLSDFWRGRQQKEKRSNVFKFLLYPFYIISGVILMIMFLSFLKSINSAKKRSEERRELSEKYRKVIKEGVLFKTVEYHER